MFGGPEAIKTDYSTEEKKEGRTGLSMRKMLIRQQINQCLSRRIYFRSHGREYYKQDKCSVLFSVTFLGII